MRLQGGGLFVLLAAGRSSALQKSAPLCTRRYPSMASATRLFSSSSSSQGRQPIIVDTQEAKSAFFQKHSTFAVVGATNDREKFGNKVFRAYLEKSYKAVPINKKQTSIEDVSCVSDLTALCSTEDASQIGVSIITPPGVTKLILEEGYRLGIREFLVQPGTIDRETIDFIDSNMFGARVIKGCVLVELGVHH